jgi:hypothetical protein
MFLNGKLERLRGAPASLFSRGTGGDLRPTCASENSIWPRNQNVQSRVGLRDRGVRRFCHTRVQRVGQEKQTVNSAL